MNSVDFTINGVFILKTIYFYLKILLNLYLLSPIINIVDFYIKDFTFCFPLVRKKIFPVFSNGMVEKQQGYAKVFGWKRCHSNRLLP